MRRRVLGAGPAIALVALTACGSSGSHTSGSSSGSTSATKTIEVTLVNAGCDPNAIKTTAGPTTFHVTNKDAAGVTEFEVLQGGRIVGEVENIAPGLDRSFTMTLKAGAYQTKCEGGTKEDGTLDVADAGATRATNTAAGTAAVATYLAYVKGEADKLVPATKAFADAVKDGNVARAKALYAPARAHYEAIEPIAESFGDLDPDIDAREGDVPAEQWSGFHRIEKTLWIDGATTGMAPVADQLVANVTKLRGLIPTLKLEPAQIANGAVELLNEVSASKITGEEDRYSHTDLADFAANVEGAKAAFDAVHPLVSDPQLATTIDQRFADVMSGLKAHTSATSIANGYALYNTLTADQTRSLSTQVDALAEPLSKVAAIVVS